MKTSLGLLVLLLLASPAVAQRVARQPLNGVDRALMFTSTALQLADWSLTLDFHNTPYQREANPILGDYPSQGRINTFCAIAVVANLAVSRLKNRTLRRVIWGAVILVEQDAVRYNLKSGFRFRFPI